MFSFVFFLILIEFAPNFLCCPYDSTQIESLINRLNLAERPQLITPVNVSISILSVISLSESEGTGTFYRRLRKAWADPRLVPDLNCSVALNSEQKSKVWLPKIGTMSAIDSINSNPPDNWDVMMLNPDGWIEHHQAAVVKVFCYFDFLSYPFDSAHCVWLVGNGENRL